LCDASRGGRRRKEEGGRIGRVDNRQNALPDGVADGITGWMDGWMDGWKPFKVVMACA